MNKEEKSMLDEIWEKSGLSTDGIAEEKAPEPEKEPVEEPAAEEKPPKKKEKKAKEKKRKKKAPAAETAEGETPEGETPESEIPAEASEEAPKEESAEEPEKKKDIKFLAIYTTVFVAVIGLLIAGSYMISYRIHRQMSENQSDVDLSQSSLQNVQDQRDAYKAKNETLTSENQLLTESNEHSDLLIGSAGDAMEQDDCLIAAQNAYINDDKELATALMHAINHTKLSEPNKAYYEQLAKLLEFEIPVIEAEEAPVGETPEGETPEGETAEGETPESETPESETPKDEAPEEKPDGILLPNRGE